MKMSANKSIFRVTGHVWGKSTDHRWIPLAKASDTELWYFSSAPEQTVEQAIETPVIWNAIALINESVGRVRCLWRGDGYSPQNVGLEGTLDDFMSDMD